MSNTSPISQIEIKIIPLFIFAMLSIQVIGQEDYAYKRSSLHLVLVDEGPVSGSKVLRQTFFTSAFPEKYDKIELQDTALDLSNSGRWRGRGEPNYSSEDRVKEAFVKNIGDFNGWFVDVMSPDEELVRQLVLEYIEEHDLARKSVAEWFQRDESGTFSMDRIMARGSYSASMLEASIADGSAIGSNLLHDAGNQLIGNSFILFTNLALIDNYMFVRVLDEKTSSLTRSLTSNLGSYSALAKKAQRNVTKSLEDGFMIWTTGYLFKLKWNEEIENTFFSDMWISRGEESPERKQLFETTDLFELEYVGNSYAQNLATKKLLGDDNSKEIITRLTMRNVDACYASLQKKYDVFKTKTPLLSVDPPSAAIGMKEGLEGGERFEVLEVREDPDTGLQSLHRVGVIQVDKKRIWDNRFGAETLLDSGADGRTYFKGSGNFLPGMLIRQIK